MESLFGKFIKKETSLSVFSCEFCDFFKNKFFTENILTMASAHKQAPD